jgi:hypothetical protein
MYRKRQQRQLGQMPVWRDASGSYSATPVVVMDLTTEDTTQNGWMQRNRTLREVPLTSWQRQAIKRQNYGGEFVSERSSWNTNYSFDVPTFVGSNIPNLLKPGTIQGFVRPQSGTLPSLASRDIQITETIGAGGTLWRAAAPTKRQANLDTFLGELREGLPNLPGSAFARSAGLAGKLRGSGSEYLNWEFGIKPMVSDLRDLAKAVLNSGKILGQLARDSGKLVRRRLTLPLIHSVDQSIGYIGFTPTPSTYYFRTLDRGITVTRTDKSLWFSGAFTYLWPQASSSRLADRISFYESQARVILGLSPDLSTAWELSKFSWLVDWFADIGDVLKGISLTGHNQLVAPYAYIMSHYSASADLYSGYALNGQPSYTASYRVERKMRLMAYPYGFDVPTEGLSAFQTSILAALGISHVPARVLTR